MTAAKNVYALMLALVIVLSGCFGNTADDTDAQEAGDSADTTSTTIVNNFYNNTTTVIHEMPEMIAIGGITEPNLDLHQITDPQNATTINTTAGQIIQVHEADGGWGSGGINIITECVGGESFSNMPANNYQLSPFYLPGSFTDCTHTIQSSNYNTVNTSWSFVYSISTVTVG